jgi:hypothetical protein
LVNVLTKGEIQSMKYLIFSFLFLFSSCISAQNNSNTTSDQKKSADDILNATVCQLLKNPADFTQKEVRVKGIYSYRFEWSKLFSAKCPNDKIIYVETTKKKCNALNEVEEMDNAGMGGRIVGIIAVGNFTKEEKHFGATGKSDYVFKISCFERAKILSRESQLKPEQLEELEKKFDDSNN